jgi:hypothetical protein
MMHNNAHANQSKRQGSVKPEEVSLSHKAGSLFKKESARHLSVPVIFPNIEVLVVQSPDDAGPNREDEE